MTGRAVGPVGEFLLDRPGVMLMTVFFAFAVGCLFIPLRHGKSWRYALPGFLVALALVLPTAYLIGPFVCAFLSTAAVMYPATRLISDDRAITVRRAAITLALAGLGTGLGPVLPASSAWLVWPLMPAVVFGVPVGAILLFDPVLRKPWVSSACSVLMFVAGFVVWTARDYYYRLSD